MGELSDNFRYLYNIYPVYPSSSLKTFRKSCGTVIICVHKYMNESGFQYMNGGIFQNPIDRHVCTKICPKLNPPVYAALSAVKLNFLYNGFEPWRHNL